MQASKSMMPNITKMVTDKIFYEGNKSWYFLLHLFCKCHKNNGMSRDLNHTDCHNSITLTLTVSLIKWSSFLQKPI